MSDDNAPVLPLNEVADLILENCDLQLQGKEVGIPYVQGSPGIGKTQFMKVAAERHGFKLLAFHYSLKPIEEVSGIPVIRENFEGTELTGTEWTLPDIMTVIYKESLKHKKIAVLLDDYHMSSPGMLALGYEMFSERKLRNYDFPENVAFIAAGNDTAKSGAKQMFGAIVNRFVIFKAEPDFDHWYNDFAIPTGINQKIISFLKSEVNRRFFLGEEDTYKPWPSPRSWSRFSSELEFQEKKNNKVSMSKIQYLGYGYLGGSASSEFAAFYDIYSKTEMDKVFDKKKSIVIPESNQDQYIYGISAAMEYINRIIEDPKKKKENIDIIGEIIIEIAKRSIEISVAVVKNISDYNKVLGKNMYIGDIFVNIRKNKEIEAKMSTTLSNILESIN